MASNRIIRPAIVTCLLSAAVLLGGCSPPLPKTWLPPSGGTMYDIPMSTDGWHAMTASPLTTRP
ncbi:MAG: hypothetical protein AAB242_02905 [Nitrospirota bacterium]